MKKAKLLSAILLFGFIVSGCGNAESKSAAYVEELPIETKEEYGQEQNTPLPVANEEEFILEKKEPYEEIEVEVNGDKGIINVGTTGAPYTELLTQAKIQLAKEGWDLQISCYDDYGKLNADMLGGSLDAHFFAHQTYVDSYNDVNKTDLISVVPVCYEVYGIYSELNEDLTNIFNAKVGIPQEAPGKARSLLFMDGLGWIALKENVGMTAVEEDIEENTGNLQLIEYTQDTLSQVMKECDYCIIGSDMAVMEGLDTEEGAIRVETKSDTSAMIYSTLLVTTQERVSDVKVLQLAKALTSKEMKEYVADTYKGALGIME